MNESQFTLDPSQVAYSAPWFVGAAAAFALLWLLLRGSRHGVLHSIAMALVAATGWLVAAGVGMAGVAVAGAWWAATLPRFNKSSHDTRVGVAVIVFGWIAAVEVAAWSWWTTRSVLVPAGAVAAAVVTSAVMGRHLHKIAPLLDPERFFTTAERRRKLDQQGRKCNYHDEGCPSRVSRGDLFEGDHIIPWAHGGRTNAQRNLQVLCARCNGLKRDLSDDAARRICNRYWDKHREPSWVTRLVSR